MLVMSLLSRSVSKSTSSASSIASAYPTLFSTSVEYPEVSDVQLPAETWSSVPSSVTQKSVSQVVSSSESSPPNCSCQSYTPHSAAGSPSSNWLGSKPSSRQ